MTNRSVVLLSALVTIVGSSSSYAQQPEPDPSEGARVTHGSLAFTPAIVFSAGHDTNVYRDPTGFADWEMFAIPQIEAWWRRPGFRVTLYSAAEFVRFGQNVGATNSQAGVRVERTRSLIRPFVGFNRRNTNANPTGFEVGYRSLRLESDLVTGSAFSLSSRTKLGVQGRFTQTRWDADARYLTSTLREKLNRDTSGLSSSVSYAVTPLTSVGTRVELSHDRFLLSPTRDGDTIRVFADTSFAKPALVFGSAAIGYMQFTSPSSGAADFSGLVSAISLGYGSPDGTLVQLLTTRDFQYSFDTDLSYYLLSSLNVSVSRRLGRRWDIAGFTNRFSGDYRPAGTVAGIGRVDRLSEFGGVIAYRVGRWARIGWSTERAKKDGPQGYEAVRMTGFLTYGSGRFQRLDRPTPFER